MRASGRPGVGGRDAWGLKKFVRADLVKANRPYRIPPLERVDLDDILTLIGDEQYFGLLAARQTGKTITLLALHDLLNPGSAGVYRCVYASLEAGRTATDGESSGCVVQRRVASATALHRARGPAGGRD